MISSTFENRGDHIVAKVPDANMPKDVVRAGAPLTEVEAAIRWAYHQGRMDERRQTAATMRSLMNV